MPLARSEKAAHVVVQTVLKANGGVVLLHDFDRGSERADYVLQTTKLLLTASSREGLSVRRLGDLLGCGVVGTHGH